MVTPCTFLKSRGVWRQRASSRSDSRSFPRRPREQSGDPGHRRGPVAHAELCDSGVQRR